MRLLNRRFVNSPQHFWLQPFLAVFAPHTPVASSHRTHKQCPCSSFFACSGSAQKCIEIEHTREDSCTLCTRERTPVQYAHARRLLYNMRTHLGLEATFAESSEERPRTDAQSSTAGSSTAQRRGSVGLCNETAIATCVCTKPLLVRNKKKQIDVSTTGGKLNRITN